MSAELKALLEGAVRGAPAEPHPVAEVVRTARTARARRLRTVVASAAAAIVAVGGVGYAAVRLGVGSGRVEPAGKVVRLSEARPAVEDTDYRTVWSWDDRVGEYTVPVGLTPDGLALVMGDTRRQRGGILDPVSGEVRWQDPARRGQYLVAANGAWNVWPVYDPKSLRFSFDAQATATGRWTRATIDAARWPDIADALRAGRAGYAGSWLVGDLAYVEVFGSDGSALLTVDLATGEASRVFDGWAAIVAVGLDAVAWVPKDRPDHSLVADPGGGTPPSRVDLVVETGCSVTRLAVASGRVAVGQECGDAGGTVDVYDDLGTPLVSVPGIDPFGVVLTDGSLVVLEEGGQADRLFTYRFADARSTVRQTAPQTRLYGVAGDRFVVGWSENTDEDSIVPPSMHFRILDLL